MARFFHLFHLCQAARLQKPLVMLRGPPPPGGFSNVHYSQVGCPMFNPKKRFVDFDLQGCHILPSLAQLNCLPPS